MAYCKSCGAYIPDGQAVCLACGFDPASEKKPETSKPKTESSAAYQANQANENNEEMRRRLEEQRRRAREQNLQWADQEKRRREEQAAREAARKEQQEKARREAEAEYARRKAEQAAQQAAQQSAQNEAPYGAAAGQGNKALAALSYLSILFLAPSIFAPQDKFARYHARQGMKLFIFGIEGLAGPGPFILCLVVKIAQGFVLFLAAEHFAAQALLFPRPGNQRDRQCQQGDP